VTRFQPKGEIAEWRMIYERLLEDADFGQIITYAELDEALGRTFIDNRSPIYRAREDLGSIRKRWLEPVPGVGYRVTNPTDHVRVSVSHRRKSQRQVSISVKVLGATDLAKLNPADLAKWDSEQRIAFAVWGVVSHEARLRRIEELLRTEGMMD
jgi:hypothetical protein